jgi:arginyl-tRNA synthetase
MNTLEQDIIRLVKNAVSDLYGSNITESMVQIQKTRKDFSGDITIVVFPLLKISKKSPEVTGQDIGSYIETKSGFVSSFNVIKGFLNLEISNSYWGEFLQESLKYTDYGKAEENSSGKTVMVEYSSPNTNKPLHLGHIRNNLLGFSVANILKAVGHTVIKVNLVNDRGIHICKSMLAWEKWGNGITPEVSGKKGDHLVGDFYVMFNTKFREEIDDIIRRFVTSEQNSEDIKFKDDIGELKETISEMLLKADVYKEPFTAFKTVLNLSEKNITNIIYKDYIKDQLEQIIQNKLPNTLLGKAQEMLQKWEAVDEKVVELWKTMNQWVYKGFDETYNKLGVYFDRFYYESQTYLLGKTLVVEGLKKGVLYSKDDGSIWADLTIDGLDHKVLLRSDGTSVYMTQDVGTAHQRFTEYPIEHMVYVVGNEQNYHFQALKIVLKKLGFEWYDKIEHLSYGMVELPEGKMKSREGTVVDADDLIEEMFQTARQMSEELGKLNELSDEDKKDTIRIIGLGALKYFILKVDPKKNMVFDPKESIDFNGNTGPFIQYTFARICSVMRKASEQGLEMDKLKVSVNHIQDKEKELIKLIYDFPALIQESAKTLSPALIANYLYEVAKEYNQFYHDYSILKAEQQEMRDNRLLISLKISYILKTSMGLLGIEAPERM